MARYSAFLGRRVEVQYRAGDVLLPASGLFVADSGRSIFLEQHFEQHGQEKQFRWEIPYQYIVRIQDLDSESGSPNPLAPSESPVASAEPETSSSAKGEPKSATASASASGGASPFNPFPHRPKTA